MPTDTVRLTQFSHGAGCGCKIAPNVLEEILSGSKDGITHADLLVGNDAKDDAAVFDLGDGRAVISTTDFFTPIVDNPGEFGRIAAANALSDVYAMGGRPLMAIAILGWPINKLAPSVAKQVVDGGRHTCNLAGIPLAGGHSIDSPEPIFGLAATGIVSTDKLLRNDTGKDGDVLILSKPLGIGVLATAEKKRKLPASAIGKAAELMMHLNQAGSALGDVAGVHAMTDVTGFGLFGHLLEMCGDHLDAQIDFGRIPLADNLVPLIKAGCVPGGTHRNWNSYGDHIGTIDEMRRLILCDPQTSGGLLVAVDPSSVSAVQEVLHDFGANGPLDPIGQLVSRTGAKERIAVV